jgi:hypothetical protein
MAAARSDPHVRTMDRNRRLKRDFFIGTLLVAVGFVILWKAGERAFFTFFGFAYLIIRIQRSWNRQTSSRRPSLRETGSFRRPNDSP